VPFQSVHRNPKGVGLGRIRNGAFIRGVEDLKHNNAGATFKRDCLTEVTQKLSTVEPGPVFGLKITSIYAGSIRHGVPCHIRHINRTFRGLSKSACSIQWIFTLAKGPIFGLLVWVCSYEVCHAGERRVITVDRSRCVGPIDTNGIDIRTGLLRAYSTCGAGVQDLIISVADDDITILSQRYKGASL